MTLRIQRRRTRGWRAPEGTVMCTRGTRWGNQFRAGDPWPTGYRRRERGPHTWHWEQALPGTRIEDAQDAVDAYDQWLRRLAFADRRALLEPLRRAAWLACWCSLDEPCHVDVIRGWLESTRPMAAPGERIEMGVHAMPGTEAEGAPAWPSLGSVESRRVSAYRAFVRRAAR